MKTGFKITCDPFRRIFASALLITVVLIYSSSALLAESKFELTETPEGVAVKLNGKLLTNYLVKSGAKPILWPLIGPYGNEITRAYPMRDAGEFERDDHVHHRSFWFTHGDVNGIDFWSETEGHGNIIHKGFDKVRGGKTGVIVTRNDWVGPDGKRICQDTRTLTFHADGDLYWIDFDTTVTAGDGSVKFGDTKEGSFGVRVAGSMKVTSEMGGKIINIHGDTDLKAWGKQSPWVDYHGPVKGNVVGITIMNHPSSFRYPSYWHARTYGLFTANPFGLHHFKGDNSIDGSHQMEKGDSFTLRYRVLVHKGTEKEADVAKHFEAYKNVKK
jgi:hypothetical protein